MLELYHTHNSVCSQKVRLILAEKNLEWKSHHLLLSKKEHLTPAYKRLNPKGVVPTLIDDENVVCESTIIIEYLDETYSKPKLMPLSYFDRAQTRIWMKRIDDEIHDPATTTISFCVSLRHVFLEQGEKVCQAWINNAANDDDRIRREGMISKGIASDYFPACLKTFKILFNDLDEHLRNRDWLVGDNYTLADLSYLPYLNRFERLRLEPILMGYPNLYNWFSRMKVRQAYRSAILEWDDPKYVSSMEQYASKVSNEVQRIYADL